MNLLRRIQSYYTCVRSLHKEIKASNSKIGQINFLAAEIVRNTHSLEKGLCTQDVRLGFGKEKIHNLIQSLNTAKAFDSVFLAEASEMAIAALIKYRDFHLEHNFSSSLIDGVNIFLQNEFVSDNSDNVKSWGGMPYVRRKSLFGIQKKLKLFLIPDIALEILVI